MKWRHGRPAREITRKIRGPLHATFYSAVVISLVIVVAGAPPANGNKLDRRNKQQVARTVAANPQAIVSACVNSGNITARGWDRNEVHARVSDGVEINLTRIDQTKSPTATELKLTADGSRTSSCLRLGDIELDVPRNASLKLQTNNGEIRVTEVARVNATSQSGSTELIKVRAGVSVSTVGGEISVRDSTGSFKLHTVGGSIDASDLGPAAIGDVFEANTIGGDIVLNRVKHQRVRVNTVSGEVDYAGPLSRVGSYSFQGISGRLRLSLPADSSFRLKGTLGAGGEFSNDFSPTSSERDKQPQHGPMRRLDAVIGSGDASINLSFFSGSIQIRKQH